MIQEWLSACFKNACPDNKRLRVRIIQESCPDVTRIINRNIGQYLYKEIFTQAKKHDTLNEITGTMDYDAILEKLK